MKIQKLLILLLCPYMFLYANVYGEYKFNKQSENTHFMSGNFEEIIRFDSLNFNATHLKKTSSKYIDEIANKILEYKKNNKNLIITIIGHAHSGKNDIPRSKDYAQQVQSYFKDFGIDTNVTVLEARGSKDPLFTSDTSLSNRVMVSMYIKEDLDKDKDGVLNNHDDCPKTDLGVKVSQNGCKIATIIMLMDNNKKENAIVVKTAQKSLLLDEPNTFTSIQSNNEISSVSKMSNEEISSLFGNVIDTSNTQHYKFVLYFEKTNLLDKSEKKLNEIIDLLSKKDDYYIKVIGHTDTKGSSIYNQTLSQERANVILQKIKEHKLKYLTLITESYGESQLAVQTTDNVNEGLNRRVEILIR